VSSQHRGGFARAFVLVNRIFGWGAIVGGFFLAAQSVIALLQGRALSDVWLFFVFGVALLLVGVLYVRAPLSRSESSSHAGDQG
jgi:hypothetical protein